MKPLKILFLLSQMKGTATHVRARQLAGQLALRGHAVTLMAVSPQSRFSSLTSWGSGFRTVETPNFLHHAFGAFTGRLFLEPGTGFLDVAARIREIRTDAYDIVQTFDHSLNVALPFYLNTGRGKAAFVSDWCDVYHYEGGLRDTYGYRLDPLYRKIGIPFRRLSHFLEFDLRRKAAAVTAISAKLRQFAIDNSVAEDRVFVVEGGADVDNIVPLPKAEARSRLGLPVTGKIVGFLGTFQMDLDMVIRSFALVKRQIPDAYLLVVGTSYGWTKELAAEVGVADACIEAGRCPDDLLPLYLAAADVHVLPLRENLANKTRWPNKMGEYMASSRPTVMNDVGDVAEVVKTNGIGLVADQSVEDFAAKIAILLKNSWLAEKMGDKARMLACTRYSWGILAARLESIYLQLL
ncbi:MAG: glycosyltransferase family 4 protein [Oryzomonas sp.]|uniref:glycosyltransferase family 4 protein n=1 Tax=Oryzomonas sp. TaxID=2855186 RepID=UPI00283D389E|nr:glycosyltransferase family 4 protein [Oryzomonas sp.]MDR3579655.1 glycosyltransferase family 4 protein [Oryzomonas sp.]